jgi:hypothetical protein
LTPPTPGGIYVNVIHIYTADTMAAIVERLDEYGKGAWIALIIAGFIVFWPLGLATLMFVMFSGRARTWRMERRGQWHNMGNCGWGAHRATRSSGNAAFDEYREQTLKRLEDEQKEFVEYLEKLRQAKDKEEFDRFMSDRKARTDIV